MKCDFCNKENATVTLWKYKKEPINLCLECYKEDGLKRLKEEIENGWYNRRYETVTKNTSIKYEISLSNIYIYTYCNYNYYLE